jgi:hypothetical protein
MHRAGVLRAPLYDCRGGRTRGRIRVMRVLVVVMLVRARIHRLI